MISTQSLERATICASAPGWATPTIAAEVDGPSRMLAGAVTRMKAACCGSISGDASPFAPGDEVAAGAADVSAGAGDGARSTAIACRESAGEGVSASAESACASSAALASSILAGGAPV